MPPVRPDAGVLRQLILLNETLRRIADTYAALAKDVKRLADNQATCQSPNANRSYSRAEAARLLGVSVRTVDRRIGEGSLKAVRTHNTVRIGGASLRRLRDGEQPVTARRVLKL